MPVTLTGLDAPTFLENAVNAAPQIIDGDVTVTGGNFDGGKLTLVGLLAEDRVSIQTSGLITFDAGTGEVRYNGVLIGQASGGVGATFTVTFNASATAAGVEAVVEHLTYANVTNDPTAARDLRLFLTDGDGDPSLGTLQFLERHGAASVVDSSSGLTGFQNISSFVTAPDFSDPTHLGQYLYAVHGSDIDFHYFRPDGQNVSPISSTEDNFGFDFLQVFDVFDDFRGTFALADLDDDGYVDIVAMLPDGSIGFWRNSDSPIALVPGGGPFAGISVPAMADSRLVDLDGDGDLDFILSVYGEALRYYQNTGTAQAAVFAARTGGDNPLGAITANAATPTFADVDGDGDLDMVRGSWNQGLLYYENTGTAAAAAFTQRTGAQNPFDGISVASWAATLLADFDGDGDLDLITGRPNGTLVYYENRSVGHALPVTVTPEADPNTSTSGDDILTGSLAPDTLDGGLGNDRLDGGAGDDILHGSAGNDYLKGGAGADAMFGGTGNDTYIFDNEGDTADETGGDGIDLIHSSVDVVLSAGIENLTLAAPGGEISGTGNSLANVMTGNAFANILLGLGGNDTLIGGGGADTLSGGTGSDSLDGGVGDDNLTGGADNDTLTGGAGADLLNGGTGADLMIGGAGHDRYVVDNLSDTITELAGGGADTVESSVSFTLGANLENLTLTGAGALNGAGNALRNTIIGNAGANTLSGGGEVDTLSGGGGDDRLLGEAGNDLLKGDAGNDLLEGGLGVDKLNGGAGDDILDGGAGGDQLTGGAGADLFRYTDLDIHRSASGGVADRDLLLDLAFADGDRIDLSAIDANTTTVQDDAFTFVGKFTRVAGQATLKYAAATNITTLELDVDGDGKADFRIGITGDHSGTTGNLYTGVGDANGGWLL